MITEVINSDSKASSQLLPLVFGKESKAGREVRIIAKKKKK